jgi:ubiquinone/menaquinone biosynthesis C-methylase UbiE
VGDVSLLAARLVGPSGTVLAVDRASPLLQIARQRAASAGIHNIRFEEADLNVLMLENDVDAIVGRTILAHLPKPAAVLQRLKGSLRPSGIVVIQEADVEPFSQIPASALFSRAKGWISEALRAAGVELNMGSRLCGTFLQAGLPRPSLIAGARVESGPLSPCYRYVADIVRSLLPLIEQTGVATAEQVDIETLTDRLREEAIAHECVTFLPRLVGAWVQISARG